MEGNVLIGFRSAFSMERHWGCVEDEEDNGDTYLVYTSKIQTGGQEFYGQHVEKRRGGKDNKVETEVNSRATITSTSKEGGDKTNSDIWESSEDDLKDIRTLPYFNPARPYISLDVPNSNFVKREKFERMEKHLRKEREEKEKFQEVVKERVERKQKQIHLMYEKNCKLNENLSEDLKKEVEALNEEKNEKVVAKKLEELKKKKHVLRYKHMEVLNSFTLQLRNFKEFQRIETRHARAKFWTMANNGRLECGFKGLDDDEGKLDFELLALKKEEEWKEQDDVVVPPAFPMIMLHPTVKSFSTPDRCLIVDRVNKTKSKYNATVLVEIHNEGVYWRGFNKGFNNKEEEESALKKKFNKFLPWGQQARKFLFTILCGSVPDDPVAIAALFQKGNAVAGGMMKVLMLDLRISETTASIQRSAAKQRVVTKQVEDSVAKDARQGEEKGASEASAERVVSYSDGRYAAVVSLQPLTYVPCSSHSLFALTSVAALKVIANKSKGALEEITKKEKAAKESLKILNKRFKKVTSEKDLWVKPGEIAQDNKNEGMGEQILQQRDQSIERFEQFKKEIANQTSVAELLKEECQKAKQRHSEDRKAATKGDQSLQRAKKSTERKILNEGTKKRTGVIDVEMSRKKVKGINEILIECMDNRNVKLDQAAIKEKCNSLPEGHQIRMCKVKQQGSELPSDAL